MPSRIIKKYGAIFLFASIFWVSLGALHLGALFLELPEAGKPDYLSMERFILFIVTYLSWAFFTTFSYFLIEKWPPGKESFTWVFTLLLAAMSWLVIVVVFREYLISFLWDLDVKSVYTMITNETPFLYLFNSLKVIVNYGICTGIFYYYRIQEEKIALLHYQRQVAEVAEKKSRFQLQALQAQLSPHFLFNCLNSVTALARTEDYARIVAVVADLAALLRYAIEGTQKSEVSLEEELNLTNHYIALQEIRFSGCFSFKIDIDFPTYNLLCPPFCVQILVENVFSHNQLNPKNPVAINVKIAKDSRNMRIFVENSPLIPLENSGSGTALNNLKERLDLLYGREASLVLENNGETFSVTLTLPIRSEND